MTQQIRKTSWLGLFALLAALLPGCSAQQSPTASEPIAAPEVAAAPSVIHFAVAPGPAGKTAGGWDWNSWGSRDDDEDDEDDEEDGDSGWGTRDWSGFDWSEWLDQDARFDWSRWRDSYTTDEGLSAGPWFDRDWIGSRGGSVEIEDDGRRRDEDGDRVGEYLQVRLDVPPRALERREYISMTVVGGTLSNLAIAFERSGLRFDKDARLKIHLGKDRVDVDTATLVGVHEWDGGAETVGIDVEPQGNGDVIIHLRVPGFSKYSLGE